MKYIESTYKIKNVDIKELLFKFDFHRYGKDCLIRRFPVYKYLGKTIIYGEFVIYDEDFTTLHVNANDLNGWSCNYNKEEYGRSKVVEVTNKNIQKELNKFIREGLILKD